MNQAEVARMRFSTAGIFADLPVARAARAWRDFCAEHFGHVEIDISDEAPFQGSIEGLTLDGGTTVGRVALSARRVSRTQAAIDRDNDGRMILILNTMETGCTIRQRGRESHIRPGNAFLYSHGHTGEFLDLPPEPCIQVLMDRSLLSGRIRHAEDLLALETNRDPHAFALLKYYVHLLLDDRIEFNPQLAGAAAAHLVDLATLVLGGNRDAVAQAQSEGARAARLAIALDLIDKHANDSALSATGVAARLGITPRYLHYLLEETGRSFSQHVLERRLDVAHSMLADPANLTRNISDIAYAAGFADVSYFNRAFRRQYGATPSDIRIATLRNPKGA